jgi:hypothetical protein
MKFLSTVFVAATMALAQDYTGPEPAKTDVLYLLHASNLIELPTTEAKQEAKKNDTTYWIEGTTSPARTPLAEPIFIVKTDKLNPDKIELYRFSVTKTRRELTIKANPGKNDRPLYLQVTKVGPNLYRIEASEQLANGEYSLSPSGSNQVFSFTVF